MRATSGVLFLILLFPAVLAKPFFALAADAAPTANKSILIIAEEHGRPDLRAAYPRLLRAWHTQGVGPACLFMELDETFQPVLDEFSAGRVEAEEVLPRGVRYMFEKWGLTGPNAYFDWPKSQLLTRENINIDAELLLVAKELRVRLIAVDRQSRRDFLTTVFQALTERHSLAAARDGFARANLADELPPSPFDYFREEIVHRRSHTMAAKVKRMMDAESCGRGLFIVGALHALKDGELGQEIYRTGEKSLPELLAPAGFRVHIRNVQSRRIP